MDHEPGRMTLNDEDRRRIGLWAADGAIELASPAVREVVGRMPARGPARSRLDALYRQLDAGLRR